MTWARLLTVVSLIIAVLAYAQAPDPDRAAAVYEQGKTLYDAKDYGGALAKFDEAIALEPTKARWHYNRGLALKKLSRTDEAIAALLESRRLEPTYKQSEIDQKLSELGYGRADQPSRSSVRPNTIDEPTDWVIIGVGLLFGGFGCFTAFSVIWGMIKALRGFGNKAAVAVDAYKAAGVKRPPAAQPLSADQLGPMNKRLKESATALAQVEHGLSLGEDPEVRRAADRAATNLAAARKGIASGTRGELRDPQDVHVAIDRANAAVDEAQKRLELLYGDRAKAARGPRAGCFFCARPIPTAKAGETVQLRSGAGVTSVAACPTCARRVGTGTPPPVLMVDGDQRRHWSELDDFDPYVEAHAPPPRATEVPVWNVMNAGAALPSLATFAGGAVLGALAAATAGRLINLDNQREAALASAAAQAAARAATTRRSTEYSDHS